MKKLLFNKHLSEWLTNLFLFGRDKDFTGVCLELDLVVDGQSLSEVDEKLRDLSHGWVEHIIEKKLPEELLNKPAPIKYWKCLKGFEQTASKVKVELEKKILQFLNNLILLLQHYHIQTTKPLALGLLNQ